MNGREVEKLSIYIRKASSGSGHIVSFTAEHEQGSRSVAVNDRREFRNLNEAIEWGVGEIAKFQEPPRAP